MQALLSPEERVAALYSRVIHRVCECLEKQKRSADGETSAEEEAARERLVEVAARVEQRWRERLTCYTGYTYAPMVPRVGSPSESVENGGNDSGGDAPTPLEVAAVGSATDKEEAHEDPDLASGAGGNPSLGRPHALMQLATPSSVFAQMFNAKRKIDQLDGTTEDDDEIGLQDGGSANEAFDGDAEDDESSSRPNPSVRSAAAPSSTASALTATPALPVDLAHVTALNITHFPLQCSAQDVNFTFKKGILRGKWKNAIITLLRRVNRFERVVPGHVLWLMTPPDDIHSQNGSKSQTGRTVEVVEAPGPDGSLVVQLGRDDGPTLNVHITDTRRFHEHIVADCNVHFHFLTS